MLLGAAVTLAALGGILGLGGSRAASPGILVTLVKADGAAPMGMGIPERTYIASAGPGAATLRNLTEDFYSASSPSFSHDGRCFLFSGRKTPSEAPAIWERGVDGSHLRKISEGSGDPAGPVYLADGRILFSDRADGEVSEARSLFSCAPDGSDLRRVTFGEQRDFRPRLLPDGRIQFQRRILPLDFSVSPLELVVHPDGTGLSAFVPSVEAARAEAELPSVKPSRGERILATTSMLPGPVPPVLTSVIKPDRKTGTLLCLNAYASRIPSVAALPPGAIQRVRIATTGLGGVELFTGEAPVMNDGSFFVEVPADTPLRIDLLEQGGRVLASFQSGIWVRPNENHACIGCHEDPELAPENRQPLAVQRPPISLVAALTGKGASGAR